MKDAYIIPKGQPLAPDQPDQAVEIERLIQISNDHRDGRLAALEKLALKDAALRVALDMLECIHGCGGVTDKEMYEAIEQIKEVLK